jgi:hypothetical protein
LQSTQNSKLKTENSLPAADHVEDLAIAERHGHIRERAVQQIVGHLLEGLRTQLLIRPRHLEQRLAGQSRAPDKVVVRHLADDPRADRLGELVEQIGPAAELVVDAIGGLDSFKHGVTCIRCTGIDIALV